MGNEHPSIKTRVSNKKQRRQSSKLQKRRLKHEKFFMAHHKAQQSQSGEDTIKKQLQTQSKLEKRVVFVSLMGLYHSWRDCPSQILYSSIFILPLQKRWVYHKKRRYQHEFGSVLQDSDFIKLLKWKDEQGLVFWMKDQITKDQISETECSSNDALVAPFWKYLSHKLTDLYDPITGQNYNALHLSATFWKQYFGVADNETNTAYTAIKKELYFVTMKFKRISEILYQSNSTLNVVTVYSEKKCENSQNAMEHSSTSNGRVMAVEESDNGNVGHTALEQGASNEFTIDNTITPICEEEQDNIWWVSADYNDTNPEQMA